MIRVIDSSKSYPMGDRLQMVNNKISFKIRKGELAMIIGPSGSGKSTVLNILGGLEVNDSGSVYVNKKNISKFSEKERSLYRKDVIGFVFQFYNLIANLTARENVELAANMAENPYTAEEVLKQVGLANRMDNFPAQLSGGEQQRVAIARALVKRPKILLCDEPTGALDFESGQGVLMLLQETAQKYGTTVVMVTHNGAIASMANRVIEIKDSRVKEIKVNKSPIQANLIEW
ncbi:ABC transporter ATP-binding protein [Carnobacterium gallinarum]|uniref:ABC transporter ATP-binding protein n=1 Tax=Carnobacterium gallinarum TaxID=2749 RepID=UPI00054CEF37|nr:ABC transporter ATP-binding protein [Carnobacterium gallinarum]